MAKPDARADTPRRRQIIEAAGRLFRANGFRAVTMEMIAAEARVAKATLYGHYRDKGEVFAGVADSVVRQIAEVLETGLAGSGGVDERLARGLVARHRTIFALVDGSPHARELMSARDSMARLLVEKIDAQMTERIAAVLREDPVFAKSADVIARTLFRGAVGVSNGLRTGEEVELQVGNFVRPYLLGLRVLAQAESGQRAQRRLARAGGRD